MTTVTTDAGSPSALRVATTLLRFRRLIVVVPAIAAVTAITVTLLLPRQFTATASFVPQSSVNPSRLTALAGLSAQLGFGNLPQASAFGSPDFYRELLRTDEILRLLVDTRYSFPWEAGRFEGSLTDFWRTKGPTPEYRRDKAVRRLRGRMSGAVDPRIQLVTLRVTSPSADLSTAVLERALELVSQFNQEQRQSQSAQERAFLGARLTEARRELSEAEDSVARFMERNRDFRNSPPLLFQYDRLQREVGLRQALYATLAQNYEQSRIEEVRDTPVLTLVERPRIPVRPDSRRLALKALLALVAGTLLGVVAAFATDALLRQAPEDGAAVTDFERLLTEFKREARRPWRLIGIGRA